MALNYFLALFQILFPILSKKPVVAPGGPSVVGGVGFVSANNTSTSTAGSALTLQSGDTLHIYLGSTNVSCATMVSLTPQNATGVTWTQIGTNVTSQWTSLQCEAQWYAKNTGAGSYTPSVAWGATGKGVLFIVTQMRGVNATTPLDKSYVNDATGGSTSAKTSPSFTTTSANEVLLYSMLTGSRGNDATAGACMASTCTLGTTSSTSPYTGETEYLTTTSTVTGTMAFVTTSLSLVGMGASFQQ